MFLSDAEQDMTGADTPVEIGSKHLDNGDDGLSSADTIAVVTHAMAWLLRRARENSGLLLTDFAEHCGVSQSVLCRVELARRVPPLGLVLRICDELKIRFSDLMRMAEDEAFPIGDRPWMTEPDELIGRHSKSEEAAVRKIEERFRQSLLQ